MFYTSKDERKFYDLETQLRTETRYREWMDEEIRELRRTVDALLLHQSLKVVQVPSKLVLRPLGDS